MTDDLTKDPGARKLFARLIVPVVLKERFQTSAPPEDADLDELERFISGPLGEAEDGRGRGRVTPQQQRLLDAADAARARAFPKHRVPEPPKHWPVDIAKAHFAAYAARFPSDYAALPEPIRDGIAALLTDVDLDAHASAIQAAHDAVADQAANVVRQLEDRGVVIDMLHRYPELRPPREDEPQGGIVTTIDIGARARAGAVA